MFGSKSVLRDLRSPFRGLLLEGARAKVPSDPMLKWSSKAAHSFVNVLVRNFVACFSCYFVTSSDKQHCCFNDDHAEVFSAIKQLTHHST